MNKTGKRILLVIGGAAIATTLVAGGRHFYGDHNYHADWMVHKVTEELELNEAQQLKLGHVRDVMLDARKQIHDSRKETRESILELLSQTEMDRQRVLALFNERTEAIRGRAPQVVDAIGDFYDSLDTAQREELREHVTEKMDRHNFGQGDKQHADTGERT